MTAYLDRSNMSITWSRDQDGDVVNMNLRWILFLPYGVIRIDALAGAGL